jgi:glycosyltransferase involved in cell wall biosynthesis
LVFLSKRLVLDDVKLLKETRVFECFNGVEDAFLLSDQAQRLKAAPLNNATLQLLFLSNLIPSKGIFDFLDALKLLENVFQLDFQASIAGACDGETFKQLDAYLKVLGKKVEYLGVIQGERKIQALRNAHIFCLPTYYEVEGQPITILEAMASGCAVVTTEHAGIPDIAEKDINAVFCSKQNPESIASSIMRAIELFPAMSQNNHKKACAEFRQDRYISRIIEILQTCSTLKSGQ